MNVAMPKKVRFVSYDQFPKFLVGENGVVVNMLTRRISKPFYSGGYLNVRLRDKNNKEVVMGLHRLLAI